MFKGGFLCYFILVLFKLFCVIENATPTSGKVPAAAAAPVAAATLTYQIVKDNAGSSNVVKHTLGGTTYAAGKKCRLIRSNEAEMMAVTQSVTAAYAEIADCPNPVDSGQTSKCNIVCNSETMIMPYDKLSPRTKYIYVFVGTTESDYKAETPPKGGIVYGLATPLLVNPQVAMSKDTDKLKFLSKTCSPVDCAIHYKDAKFESLTKGSTCDAATSTASVEFDLLIPHYEMRCPNYPSFFYNMPNSYMKENIEVYKPQYYLTTKTDDTKKVFLKFSDTTLSSEICVFNIKGGINSDSGTEFESKCGNTADKCYAPCKDVELTVEVAKEFYKILIQTRNHDITKTATADLDGFSQTKLAIKETADGLLPLYTNKGFTFDGALFAGSSTSVSTNCVLKHYPADKLKPTGTTTTRCNTETKSSSGGGTNCKTDCTKLVIEELSSGKPYIIEIESSDITDPTNFKEQIFIRTSKGDNKDFQTTDPSKTESATTLTAIAAAGASAAEAKKDEPNCEYYISPAGKDTFYAAKCNTANPCRGRCREPITIIDLEPNTPYDIKVIADKEYNEHVYQNVLTTLATLTVTPKYTMQGLELNAQLSKKTPEAICHYTIQVKKNEKYEDVYTCIPQPAAPAANTENATSEPGSSSTPGSSTSTDSSSTPGSSSTPDSNVTPPKTDAIQSSIKKSGSVALNIARVGTAPEENASPTSQVSDTDSAPVDQPSGSGEQAPAGGSDASAVPAVTDPSADAGTASVEPTVTQAPVDPTKCTTFPLCSSIVFEKYDAKEEYKVLVTAVGKSREKETIIIPTAPKATPTESDKAIYVTITRDGESLKIENQLPSTLTEQSTCKWELRNASVGSMAVVKKCRSRKDAGCKTFPSCKSFTIEGMPDDKSYHLTVLSSTDVKIFGVATIEQGAKSSASSKTLIIIIVAAVVGVLIICAVGFMVVKKSD